VRVCLVWLADPGLAGAVLEDRGPWTEVFEAGPGLLLVETDETVSRLYHHLKPLLPADAAMLVAPLTHRPKARLLTDGAVSWLRDRLPLPDR
jgi:hypothetical protein